MDRNMENYKDSSRLLIGEYGNAFQALAVNVLFIYLYIISRIK